jgi:peptidoglycan/LPS O-acetylase OafA/YrhL
MSTAASGSTGSGPARLPALDALRAVGAIGVLAYHVGFDTGISLHGTWNGLLARLDLGVAVFFVLSGFLLFRPFAQAQAAGAERPGAGRYLWRRALRILPAYWVAVVVCLTVLPQNSDLGWREWVHSLTLTQIYERGQLHHGLTQTWSLATEVVFYLLLPLAAIVALGRRWRPGRTVVVCLLSVVITGAWLAILAFIGTSLYTMWLPSYALWFGVGMAFAAVHVALATGTAPPRWRLVDDLAAAPLACWGLALGLLAIASTPLAGPRDLAAPTVVEFATKNVLFMVIAALILLPLAFGPGHRITAAFSGGLARWLGAISYGIFLWHPFVIDATFLVTGWPEFSGGYLRLLIVALVGAIVLASLSYYAMELPLQRWGVRRVPRRRRTATESHSAVAVASATS